MKKAVIYTRVSDPSQIENNSLESQANICSKFAKQKNLEVVKIYREEGKSAKDSIHREELRKLILFCAKKTNNISTVIVYKIDRFSRNLADGLGLITVLAKYGVEVVSATEAFDQNAMGKAMRNIMLTLGQLDNELKGERVKDNMQASFRNGFWPFKVPVGYKRKYKSKEQNKGIPPIPDKNISKIITKMFHKAAEGIYNKTQLAKIMNLDGFADYYGKKADHKIVKKILERTFYYGLMHASKWNEDSWGKHEPIIDRETWEKAYHKVVLKKKNYSYSDNEIYPLKGTLRCELCGELMTTSPSKGRNKIVYYYECKGCRKLRLNAASAHKEFNSFLKSIRPNERVINLFKELVFKDWDKVMNSFLDELDSYKKRINKLKSNLKGIRKAVENGIYTEDEGKEEADQVRAEIALLEVEKGEIKIEQYDVEAVKSFTEHFLNNFDRLWDSLDLVKKQALQKQIFPEGCLLTKNKKIRTTSLSPSFSLIKELNKEKGINVTPWGIEPQLSG